MIKEIRIGTISFKLNYKSKEAGQKLDEIQEYIEKKIQVIRKKIGNKDFDHIMAAIILDVLDEYWEAISPGKKVNNKGTLLDKMDILNNKILGKIEELDENMGKF
ncbi:hypothetical protein J7L48_04845 [bacterium]|nr:hypothetical protein [bacterium]